jgi:uncharacterized SAM-binding protein YcdF (DUF218 family)
VLCRPKCPQNAGSRSKPRARWGQALIESNKHAASARAPFRTALHLLQFVAKMVVAAPIIGALAFFGSMEGLSGRLMRADGVVVFTGEPRRILTGVQVLSGGHARRMLITGTELSAGTDTAEVMAKVRKDYSYWASCCIDLDPGAQNTSENARDATRWARDHEFSSVILVTTDYHMPRALLELRSALPDIRIIPHPLRTGDGLSPSLGRIRLVIDEYAKFVVALLRAMR